MHQQPHHQQTNSVKRIMKELKDIKETEASMTGEGSERILFIAPVDDSDLYNWKGRISPPKGSNYHGGTFYLDIKFPTDYPFKPPRIRFLTRIFHPNINTNGTICLDILSEKWSPALTITKVMMSICSWLDEPNPDDPLVPDIASLCKLDQKMYKEKCREWTERYAMDRSGDIEEWKNL
ncbi:ubiquitin-conjugating enzyme E2 D [Nematocida homosporus]|uniref:ubiquitin-conjugating enzyme E2 D n=1 Tax=Nematocida homosporus TaxID=1912981 RepID=UPI0022211773|nr:ubiquitin-conjugating enzyme E2 D [Nematocida homosporus]KAI5187001.1 ubiquitin-conjugating enzyme E2 D [Nematocida homosporus]